MRLTAAQLALLRRSAQQPGRRRSPAAEDAPAEQMNAVVDVLPDVKRAMTDASPAGTQDRRPGMGKAPASVATEADRAPATGDWRPIATAPALRDVEIRTADMFGSYALLYPCRYLPEQGWINAILKTPLTVEPVEWREWGPEPAV
jgi:hypothetical protein